MKRLIRLVAIIALAVTCSSVAGADEHNSGGLGFRPNDIGARNADELRIGAPIGVRWWLGEQKVGIDLGFGFSSHKDEAADKYSHDWSIDAGIPICVKRWDRVHVIARPGFDYASQQDFVAVVTAVPGTFETITDKFITISGEIEAEVFLADNVSVSASHGVGFVNYKPGETGATSTTDFGTFGRNFTQVGFHVYLWGKQ
ncbi:MAG: hypothetical protein E6K81_03530 [Candidatus Eisenbacteria bacterium]|uniref:Porin family protein n=1 Tax=Eiseniibacteriota bacterium TaxID=2212470 RepID=A0A538UCQ4_UNCEI|nr:MAG: hypothetical protein E6K81_03530 [Candidatus Eisenbacteria bacterium]